VAIHAAQLGAQVSLVSRVGCDELGDRACAELAAAGIDVSLVQLPDRRRGRLGSPRVDA
jgi:sugar/nucleoside kinase (ribokinase family)